MKQLLPLIAAMGLALSMGLSHAADAPKTAQQSKMTTCNASATGKKGDERKAFMKDCLSAKPAAAAATPTCDQTAADKKLAGAAKTSFLKKCMADSK